MSLLITKHLTQAVSEEKDVYLTELRAYLEVLADLFLEGHMEEWRRKGSPLSQIDLVNPSHQWGHV